MYVFFDTETTGLADSRKMPDQEHIRVCQFAAIMCDANRRIVGQFKSLIKPEGWTVHPDTAKFHGITTEDCNAYGISMKGVLGLFDKWCAMSGVRVAFNNSYDLHMLAVEQHHHVKEATYFPELQDQCAMAMEKPLLKLPATERMIAAGRGSDFKPPNLKEAYRGFFGEDFDGAHDALADVKATMRCYFHIKDAQTP